MTTPKLPPSEKAIPLLFRLKPFQKRAFAALCKSKGQSYSERIVEACGLPTVNPSKKSK